MDYTHYRLIFLMMSECVLHFLRKQWVGMHKRVCILSGVCMPMCFLSRWRQYDLILG